MTRRLWLPAAQIHPLAEHAAACPQRNIREQYRPDQPDVPALLWSREHDGDWLTSNGAPAWYDASGAEHRVRAETWTYTDTGATGNPRPYQGDGLMSLHATHLDGRRTLLDLLRFARQHDVPWLGVNADRTSELHNDRYLLSRSRHGHLPRGASWTPVTVTCATVGGGTYRALVADGYTTSSGGPLCRFPRHEVERMAHDLHELATGDVPGQHPVLRLAFRQVSVQWEDHTDEGSRWLEQDLCRIDADGHYAIGAYQWPWVNATAA
ncbi:hypothetical protein AB0H28_14515 [Micromonospora sp. NPDC050980]|uniref:hypothetical protein n=1 Tax=Micromonospora sp. NPDC050980 TaxID=3155161 RepID=UPI0033E6AC36